MSIGERPPGPGRLHHSAHDSLSTSQTSQTWLSLLPQHLMVASISWRGESLDTFVLEGVFPSMEQNGITETARKHPFNTVKAMGIHFMEMFYNICRLHSVLSYRTTNACEAKAHDLPPRQVDIHGATYVLNTGMTVQEIVQ